MQLSLDNTERNISLSKDFFQIGGLYQLKYVKPVALYSSFDAFASCFCDAGAAVAAAYFKNKFYSLDPNDVILVLSEPKIYETSFTEPEAKYSYLCIDIFSLTHAKNMVYITNASVNLKEGPAEFFKKIS